MIALVLGLALIIAGIGMDAPPIHAWLIRTVTSRSLGTLAPGYAAGDRGLRTYTALVRAFGVIVISFWIATLSIEIGGILLIVGLAAFVFFSVRAISGEVRVYRAFKR